VWDTGHGLSKETSTTFALATLAGSLGLTVLLWLIVIVL
jgi:succinate dehydrogenase / fumarate reductase cytochrome b subunit